MERVKAKRSGKNAEVAVLCVCVCMGGGLRFCNPGSQASPWKQAQRPVVFY